VEPDLFLGITQRPRVEATLNG